MSIASLYPSINPSLLLDFANSKVLDSRVTFTRTTTATYYDGVTTAVAEQNLMTYSQEFDNAVWNPQSSSVTSNAVSAPDGTMTADKLVSQSAAGIYPRLRRLDALSNRTQTFSIYAKKAEWSYIAISQDGARVVYFDLNAGTIVSSDTSTGTITSVGNGWFRCTYSYTSTVSVSQPLAIMAGNTATYGAQTGDGTSGIYIWGAQLEDRSSATAYTATTTQAITNYIPVLQTAAAGQARFDHNPTTGESLGLLIEEARTNLATYSAQFDNAAWTKSGGSITLNGNVAPDGTVSADIFVENTSNSTHELGQVFTINMTSTAYTMSIYVKANGRTKGSIVMVAPGPTYQQFGCNFNLTAQTATVSSANGGVASSATITPVGNDWYRITATGYTTYNGSQTFAFYLQDSSGNVIYTGNGFSGMSVWGAQLEAGSFATSYIPTVASSVTRNADAASMTGTNFSSWFNNGEGTLYGEMQRAQGAISGTNFHIATIGNSSSSGNYYKLRFQGSSTARAALSWTSGAEQCAFIEGTTTAGNFYKLCLGVKVNDFGFSSDNTTASTDTSGTVPIGLNQMIIGADVDGTSQIANNRIRKLAYYPIRVTNTQLQSLTV